MCKYYMYIYLSYNSYCYHLLLFWTVFQKDQNGLLQNMLAVYRLCDTYTL